MANLKRAGQSGAVDTAASIAQFKEQIAALNDMMRQVGGNAAVNSGSADPADPLNSPYILYVNPYIGDDQFVGGSYNSFEEDPTASKEDILAARLKRIELQRLECGYSPQRPFKTINRAALEAAMITSKAYCTDSGARTDLVSIILAPGAHTVHNNPGRSSTSIGPWAKSRNLSIKDLIAFNPAGDGGLILPRGVSLCGPDLRKTVIRPSYVPANVDERSDYSNRGAIFKVTGTGYFFGFTLRDCIGEQRSHHLLDSFQFIDQREGDVTRNELTNFYAKVNSALGVSADLSATLLVPRLQEYQIVGPIDSSKAPTEAWDTTASASPYIFNCSVRSNYGLGGLFMDGDEVGGLKSCVTANFTGVSLQKDMSCWQKFSAGNWTTVSSYADYINTDPDDIRMNPKRLSRHISAVNNAVIQEVSVFAIGHGCHHYTDNGGEISITNSNSNFGGCCAISKGYKSYSFPQDKNWSTKRVRVPLNPGQKEGNVTQVYLGVTVNDTNKITNTIYLQNDLTPGDVDANNPKILEDKSYSLREETYIWIENPRGIDYCAKLDSNAWAKGRPDQIKITATSTPSGRFNLFAEKNASPGEYYVPDRVSGGDGDVMPYPYAGKRVYIRRVVDTRTPEERRCSIKISNTTSTRIPERNFIVQTDPVRSGGYVNRLLNKNSELLLITQAGEDEVDGAAAAAQLTIKKGESNLTYSKNTQYYAGQTVRYNEKHYIALKDTYTTTTQPVADLWGEAYVHMQENYSPEDIDTTAEMVLVFDTDTSYDSNSVTLGIDWSTVWTASDTFSQLIQDRYRASTDYKGLEAFLRAMGIKSGDLNGALKPRAEKNRDLDPDTTDLPVPSGGAADGRGYWALEFRRPSMLRCFAHAFEWPGMLNYSKAIPSAQKQLSPQNKFTYYWTNVKGGRVVPQGSNEEGYNVSPKGLEDVETGQTLSVEAIGNSTIDESVQTDFENIRTKTITVDDEIKLGDFSIKAGKESVTTSDPGFAGGLATTSELKLTQYDTLQPVAKSDKDIDNSADKLITLPALNYWMKEQSILTASPDTPTLFYVAQYDSSGELIPYKTASFLRENPPIDFETACSSLSQLASYCSSLYAGTNTVVTVRIAGGLYNPSSTWKCKVKFEAWDSQFKTRHYPSNDINKNGTPGQADKFKAQGAVYSFGTGHNYFSAVKPNGSARDGYLTLNKDMPGTLTTKWEGYAFPQFISGYLSQRGEFSGGYHTWSGRTMSFADDVEFQGGFFWVGIHDLIDMAGSSDNLLGTAAGFKKPQSADKQWWNLYDRYSITNFDPATPATGLVQSNFEANDSNRYNLSRLLKAVGNIPTNTTSDGNARDKSADFYFGKPLIELTGDATCTAIIKDTVFGAQICGRHPFLGYYRAPLIHVINDVALKLYNIYFRGNARFNKVEAGLDSGEKVRDADQYRYGDKKVFGDWDWQMHSPCFVKARILNLTGFGGTSNVIEGSGFDVRQYYKDRAGEYMPNHIYFLNEEGNVPDYEDFTVVGKEDSGNDGPFFDVLFHVQEEVRINNTGTWRSYRSVRGVKSRSGIIGQLGTNRYNNTMTRGFQMGDPDTMYQGERGYIIKKAGSDLLLFNKDEGGKMSTIWQMAGGDRDNAEDVQPGTTVIWDGSTPLSPGQATFLNDGNDATNISGENTVGKTMPCITTDSYNAKGNNGSKYFLRVGLRTYEVGIDPTTASQVYKRAYL